MLDVILAATQAEKNGDIFAAIIIVLLFGGIAVWLVRDLRKPGKGKMMSILLLVVIGYLFYIVATKVL